MAKDKKEDIGLAHDLLLKEVDEEVRAERLRKWWERFGSWLVGAAVAVVLVTIGYEVWQTQHQETGEKATALLLEAEDKAQEGQYVEAATLLEQIEGSDSGVAELASLHAANLLARSGEPEKANVLYEQLAKSGGNEAITNFARLKLGEVDAIKSGTAFYATAQEFKAQQLYAEGKAEEAYQVIAALVESPDLPASLRTRLTELMQVYR